MLVSVTTILLIAFLVSEKNLVDAISCLSCSSFASGCGATVTSTTNLAFEQCNGLCFTRTDGEGSNK
jgi:hypothetical protein